MSNVQMLRAFMEQRAAAAVEEMFGLVERTIRGYEEEICRSEQENQRKQKLLDAVLSPEVVLRRADVQLLLEVKHEFPEEAQQDWSSSLVQKLPHIKEEQEELGIKEDVEQIYPTTVHPSTAALVKSDEAGDEAESSEQQQESREEPAGDEGGGPGAAGSFHPEGHLQTHTDANEDDTWTNKPGSDLNQNAKPVESVSTKHMEIEAGGEAHGGPGPEPDSSLETQLQTQTYEDKDSEDSDEDWTLSKESPLHFNKKIKSKSSISTEKRKTEASGDEKTRRNTASPSSTSNKRNAFNKLGSLDRRMDTTTSGIKNNDPRHKKKQLDYCQCDTTFDKRCGGDSGGPRARNHTTDLERRATPNSDRTSSESKSRPTSDKKYSSERHMVATTATKTSSNVKNNDVRHQNKQTSSAESDKTPGSRSSLEAHVKKTKSRESFDSRSLKTHLDARDGPSSSTCGTNVSQKANVKCGTSSVNYKATNMVKNVERNDKGCKPTRIHTSGSDKTSGSRTSLESHAGEKPKSRKCFDKNSSLKTHGDVTRHRPSGSTGGTKRSCSSSSVIDNVKNMASNVESNHEGCKKPKIHSSEYDKAFGTRSSLESHSAGKASDKTSSATTSSVFTDAGSHDENNREGHKANVIHCQVCGRTFNRKSKMDRHMRSHTGEKPFSCSLCGRNFSRKSNLTAHMNIHRGEKPFGCSICPKRVMHRGELRRHMMIHTDERPLACPLCSVRCRQQSDLQRHMIRHTGAKPFSCSVCQKRFADKNYIKKHMLIHIRETGLSSYVSSVRGKTPTTGDSDRSKGEPTERDEQTEDSSDEDRFSCR